MPAQKAGWAISYLGGISKEGIILCAMAFPMSHVPVHIAARTIADDEEIGVVGAIDRAIDGTRTMSLT